MDAVDHAANARETILFAIRAYAINAVPIVKIASAGMTAAVDCAVNAMGNRHATIQQGNACLSASKEGFCSKRAMWPTTTIICPIFQIILMFQAIIFR